MKKVLLMMIFAASTLFAAEFVSPLTFDGSEEQKKAVIAYIEEEVGSRGFSIKEEREKKEITLKAFKELIKIEDKEMLQKAINLFCSGDADMCNYNVIHIAYKDLKLDAKKLEW